MADAAARVGITIDATDKTSPAFNSASKGAGRLTSRFKSMAPHLKALPESAGKASAALLLLQGSTGQMSAGVADAVNKIGALVAMMAVGGPLGIGIAAITLGLLGVQKILEAVRPPLKDDVDEFAEMNSHFRAGVTHIKPLITGFNELRRAMDQVTEANRSWRQASDDALDAATSASRLLRENEEKLAAKREARFARREARRKEEETARDAAAKAEAERLTRVAAVADDLIAKRESTRQILLARQEADAKFLDAKLTESEGKRRTAAVQTANVVANASANLAAAVIANDKDAKRAAISAAIDVAQAKIVAAAASGAANAFEGAQKLPFPANVIVGPAVAAVVLAAILAFRSKINLAQGGLVQGGTPGRDSIPALLRPGERVLTPEQQRDGAGGGGGGDTYNFSMPTLMPSVTEGRRMAKEVVKQIRSAKRLGVTGFAGA